MSPLFETILGPLVFVLIFQPFTCSRSFPSGISWSLTGKIHPERLAAPVFPGRGADHGTGPVRCFFFHSPGLLGLQLYHLDSPVPAEFLTTRKYWVGHLFILSFRVLLPAVLYFLWHFFCISGRKAPFLPCISGRFILWSRMPADFPLCSPVPDPDLQPFPGGCGPSVLAADGPDPHGAGRRNPVCERVRFPGTVFRSAGSPDPSAADNGADHGQYPHGPTGSL